MNDEDEETGLLIAAPVPRAFNWGGTLQYSMPYLKSSVQDSGLPGFVNRMIPIVEWNLSTETSNFSGEERTTGTINPGAIYVADKFQLARSKLSFRSTGLAATTLASWHIAALSR